VLGLVPVDSTLGDPKAPLYAPVWGAAGTLLCGTECISDAICCPGATNCCCSCDYVNTQTGAGFQGACDAATTLNKEQCHNYRVTHAPPGYDKVYSQYGCADQIHVWYPFNVVYRGGCNAAQCEPL
jgi:hypothetical protein